MGQQGVRSGVRGLCRVFCKTLARGWAANVPDEIP